jgi:hypothetical protein
MFKTNKKGLFFLGMQTDTGLITYVFVIFIFQPLEVPLKLLTAGVAAILWVSVFPFRP